MAPGLVFLWGSEMRDSHLEVGRKLAKGTVPAGSGLWEEPCAAQNTPEAEMFLPRSLQSVGLLVGLPQERTSINGCSSRTGGEPDQLLIPLLFTSLPCYLGCHFILSDNMTLTPGKGQGKKEVMGEGGREGERSIFFF